jgi:CBS domain-containing protein
MPAEELVGVNRKERIRTEVDDMGLDTLMNTRFETVSPSDTVNTVLKKMRDLDIHEVPVTADGKKLLGVVSYGTLLKRRNLSIEAKADTVMAWDPQNRSLIVANIVGTMPWTVANGS